MASSNTHATDVAPLAGAGVTAHTHTLVLGGIFLVSGFPALVYQLLWQRALFTIYGVNIESITVVVAAFMLGLGLGSVAGGAVSRMRGVPHLLIFGGAEIGIGLYGFASLALFKWAATLSLDASTFETGLYTFMMVLVPTLLMGATLPLLVAHLVGVSRNVGRSVGVLYFVNTLGSAIACFVGALWLFGQFGAAGSIAIAAVINLAVGAGAITVHVVAQSSWFGTLRSRAQSDAATPTLEPDGRAVLAFPLTLALAAAIGFISLSYEIVWARVFGFVSGGAPDAFPFLLGAFLLGIALGSLVVCRFCGGARAGDLPRLLGRLLLAVNLLGFLVVPILSLLVRRVDYHWGLLMVVLAAGGLGASLPLLSHLGIAPDRRAGQRLSFLYLANIAGSTAGTLVTGFVLMDTLPLATIAVLLLVMGLVTAGVVLYFYEARRRPWFVLLALFAALAMVTPSSTFTHLYARLLHKKKFGPERTLAHVVETKSGVIAVGHDATVYGGGIYDGMFSVDLVHDHNMIIRPYALSALHPQPRDVLMIGLSSGSWAQVIANHPQVERLTIVEINPGYEQLIPEYAVNASLLKNPKVSLVIDDGRRWLRRHPEARFDAVVMNTTHHWRAYASNVLSVEFLELVRGRLKPGGIVFYNTTWSNEALRTGITVFPHAVRVTNFLAAGDSPIQVDAERWRRVLEGYTIDGRPVFDLADPAHQRRLDEVVALAATLAEPEPGRMAMETRERLLHSTAGARVITDDNMGTEWRRRWPSAGGGDG